MLYSLSLDEVSGHADSSMNLQAVETAFFFLANDLHAILGEAMNTTTAVFS